MFQLPAVIATLKAHQPDLIARWHVKIIGVFGSVARGDAGVDSDLDLLVEFEQPIGWEITDMCEELEELLGGPVDVVSRHAIRPRLWPSIEEDLVRV